MEPETKEKGKKRKVWSDRDTQSLLELWAERATDLRRAKRNGHIYKEISMLMGNKFTPEEVHIKIRNFTQKYREEKKEMGPSGGSPSSWKFYSAVHRIIGSNAANNAEILESFSFVNAPDASCQPSPESHSMQSPGSQSLLSMESDSMTSPPVMISPTSPLSPIDTASPSTSAASSCTRRKRNHSGEMIKIMKEQTAMLKSMVQDSQSLSTEIVKAIQEQNETSREFLTLMKTLIDK